MSDTSKTVGDRAQGRGDTPEKSGNGAKACSTPTNTEDTISDMTLDASCITAVKSKTNMDETVKSRPPVLKMRSATAAKPVRSTQNSRNMTMAGSNRQVGTARKPAMLSSLKTSVKQVGKAVEALESDPDEVTDEMMENAYCRYLQAKFIAMKSKEARKKVEEDSRNQILAAFFATEGLRMEVQRRELRKVLDESLASMRSSLAVVDKNVAPTLEVLQGVEGGFGSVASHLEGIKDNLVVEGLNLGDQGEAQQEMERLKEMFVKFNEDMEAYKAIASEGEEELVKIATAFKEVSEDYEKIVKLTNSVKKLLKETESLAIREASLTISLKDIGVGIED